MSGERRPALPDQMMNRRVRRPAQHDQLMKRLVSDGGPFTTLAEVLTFAAGLGFAEQRREPFASSDEPIPFDVFQRLGAERFIDMLAASQHEDVKILSPEMSDERLTVFEEFANGGLDILNGRLKESQPDLESLLAIVLDREQDAPGSGPDEFDFDAVADELSR